MCRPPTSIGSRRGTRPRGRWERGFAINGAVTSSSMFLPSAAASDSGSSIGCARALHDENTYEAINTERRANSSSITVCP